MSPLRGFVPLFWMFYKYVTPTGFYFVVGCAINMSPLRGFVMLFRMCYKYVTPKGFCFLLVSNIPTSNIQHSKIPTFNFQHQTFQLLTFNIPTSNIPTSKFQLPTFELSMLFKLSESFIIYVGLLLSNNDLHLPYIFQL